MVLTYNKNYKKEENEKNKLDNAIYLSGIFDQNK